MMQRNGIILLLHYAGVDVQDIYKTLPTPAAPADGSSRSDFETAVLQFFFFFFFFYKFPQSPE